MYESIHDNKKPIFGLNITYFMSFSDGFLCEMNVCEIITCGLWVVKVYFWVSIRIGKVALKI